MRALIVISKNETRRRDAGGSFFALSYASFTRSKAIFDVGGGLIDHDVDRLRRKPTSILLMIDLFEVSYDRAFFVSDERKPFFHRDVSHSGIYPHHPPINAFYVRLRDDVPWSRKLLFPKSRSDHLVVEIESTLILFEAGTACRSMQESIDPEPVTDGYFAAFQGGNEFF